MIRRRNKWKKYAIPGGFGIAIAISILCSISDMQQKSAGMSALSKQANNMMFNEMEIRLTDEQIAKQQKVSAYRINNFQCVAMVDRGGSKLATLQRGGQALNRGLSAKLAPGTCVVGANGETAIIGEKGLVTAIAAGRPEYAQAAVRRVRGAKVYYYHPEIEEGNSNANPQ